MKDRKDEHDIDIAKSLARNGYVNQEVPDQEAMEDTWFITGLAAEKELDTDAALEKVSKKMFGAKRIPAYVWWRVAAALGLVIVASVVLIYTDVFNETPEKVVQAYETTGTIASYDLPDGSNAVLNRFSSLDYELEGSAVRHLSLSGEAFFDVIHDPLRPFVVTTADARVEVLGTQFNIRAYPGQPTEVTVKKGKVKTIFLEKGETYILTAGDQVVNGSDDEPLTRQKEVSDANYLAWKTGLLEFKDATLPEVASRLEKLYDISIKFEDNLLQCKITAKFENRDLDFILKVLEATLSIQVKKEGREYAFTGNGCK